jgi:hypothetical protein
VGQLEGCISATKATHCHVRGSESDRHVALYCNLYYYHIPVHMFTRLSLAFVVISLTAFLCVQSADAAKGPKITHKVYFDIKHGDNDVRRSTFSFRVVSITYLRRFQSRWVFMGRWGCSFYAFHVSQCPLDGAENCRKLSCLGHRKD